MRTCVFHLDLCEMSLMQHLDISDDKQFTSDVARQLLGQPGILPALVSLDVSGRKQVCVFVCVCMYDPLKFYCNHGCSR